jgi:hypothetical protein
MRPGFYRLSAGVLALAGLSVLALRNSHRPAPNPERAPAAPPVVSSAVRNLVATNRNSTTTAVTSVGFRLRPFAVVSVAGAWQWTAEDGRDTNVIRQLAHSDLEYLRMVEENARIKRRQLIYRSETTAALVERAKLARVPVERMTLPALDGREVDVEITRSELNPSGQQGMLAGRVSGRADSMVTLAFKGGREAFTVLSPADGLFLQAEPREPGEVIVKSIDPDVYASGYCGNR